VDQLIQATSPTELTITTDKVYAPSFFYNIMTSIVTSVVDKQEAMAHEVNGDFGYEWLKTNSAGSGPYRLVSWTANDSVVLEQPGEYWGGDVALARVFLRHVGETATRRLLLENGDVDLTRRLPPNDVEALRANPDINIVDEQRGRIFYVSANMKNEILANPKVLEALRYLIDYEGMANSFLKGQFVVHQSFLPSGFLGAIDDKPFTFDPEKAKALLAEAGYPDGFAIQLRTRNESPSIDMAQAIQGSMAEGGVQVEINPGTGAEVLGDYRARMHELMLQNWGPDYPDPHTNASTFAANPDNSDEGGHTGYLAWRNAYAAESTNAMVEQAVQEQDADVRRQLYEEMQRISQQESPIICMFQEIEQVTLRSNVEGFSTGLAVGSAYYWTVTK
jgi:peptide/nickel transport system substrate-binding protein